MSDRIVLKMKLIKGRECHTPQNDLAKLLCEMTDRQFLGTRWFRALREVGFEIEVLDED